MEIKLYTTGCPKCKILKMKLDNAGITYDVCDDINEMLALGFKTAPILMVDDLPYDFGDAVKLIERMKAE